MIKRDEYAIIVQHNLDYPYYADGGDSAARTGIMALCGSEIDSRLINKFVICNTIVRHPYQEPFEDPTLTSRDQLIQWSAGVYNYDDIICIKAVMRHAKAWFINKDFLPPDVKLYLYKCAGFKPPLWLKLFGYPMMFLSLLWACFVTPKDEQNKMICMCSIYGTWWIRRLHRWHPNLEKNLIDYWCGHPFRDQPEIYLAIKNYIEKRLS